MTHIQRRSFLKTLGVTFASLGVTKSFARNSKTPKEFYGILYDSTRCIGCQSCEFACAEKNGLPEPVGSPDPGRIRTPDTQHRLVINVFETSNGEQFMRRACNHCNEPACASGCLTKAMYKTEEGPVTWRKPKCMGCRSCMVSCPFDVPKFEYESANPGIQKCTMCYETVKEGGTPACVENCPAEALTFGYRKDLLEEAKRRIYTEPDRYYHKIYGEYEAGGTGVLYLAAVPFEDLGMKTNVGTTPYPEYTKTFLYSVPLILTLWPPFLVALFRARKNSKNSLSELNKN